MVKLKDEIFQSVTQKNSEKKEIPRTTNGSRTDDFPITSSDTLPVSYGGLVIGIAKLYAHRMRMNGIFVPSSFDRLVYPPLRS